MDDLHDQPTAEPQLEVGRAAPPGSAHSRRYPWATLLQRVFGIDALQCPRCGSTLRLVATIEDPAVARKILECLKLPARAPPLDCASGIDDPAEPPACQQEIAWEFD